MSLISATNRRGVPIDLTKVARNVTALYALQPQAQPQDQQQVHHDLKASVACASQQCPTVAVAADTKEPAKTGSSDGMLSSALKAIRGFGRSSADTVAV